MKRSAVMMLVLAMFSGNASATALLGRSATVNKFLQVFGWANLGYNQTALSYDWSTSKYVTPEGFVPTKTLSCDVTLAIGLPGKVDVNLVAPLAAKQEETAKSSGLGDVMLYARYGLLQTSLLPIKAALILGANLPAADENAAPALGDRTTDIAVGASTNTVSLLGFLAHARAAYWLNGKLPDTEKKVGDMVEYNLTLDYSVTRKVTPEICVAGYSRAQTDSSGTLLPNTDVSQHTLNVLVMWKPVSTLTIRPKVAVPLTSFSKGGSLAKVYGGLDIWAFLP